MPADHRPWRLSHGAGDGLDPVDGATNMAIDTALLDSVRAGAAPALRLYRWSPATLSFGRSQPARGRYDTEAAAARGIDFVRRPTGGQAVLHDDELTYAVVAPVALIGKPRAAYTAINWALVAALRSLGVDAELAGDETAVGRGAVSGAGPGAGSGFGIAPGGSRRTAHDWDAACFRRPARGEVVVGGAKLVGSAQRMEGRTILQHGSILMGGSQAPAEALLRVGAGSTSSSNSNPNPNPNSSSSTSSGWTTLVEEMDDRPSVGEVAEAVRDAVEAVLGVELVREEMTVGERERAEALVERFGSEDWTWRR